MRVRAAYRCNGALRDNEKIHNATLATVEIRSLRKFETLRVTP
jgi:hypothetical protein